MDLQAFPMLQRSGHSESLRCSLFHRASWLHIDMEFHSTLPPKKIKMLGENFGRLNMAIFCTMKEVKRTKAQKAHWGGVKVFLFSKFMIF